MKLNDKNFVNFIPENAAIQVIGDNLDSRVYSSLMDHPLLNPFSDHSVDYEIIRTKLNVFAADDLDTEAMRLYELEDDYDDGEIDEVDYTLTPGLIVYKIYVKESEDK